MKRALKIIGIVLGVVVLLVVGAIVTVSILFDPNQYKGDIIKLVKDQTGRELKIDGRMSLSFFPWLGAEIKAVELENASGFGKEPFARVEELGIKVKVLPLLARELVVDRLYVDGLKLSLARDHSGRSNWDDLAGAQTAPAITPEKLADTRPAPGETGAVPALAVAAVVIRNGEVVWQDQQSGARYAIHKLNFKTGRVVAGKPVDIDLNFDLESNQPALRTPVLLKARASFDPDTGKLDMPSLAVDALGVKLRLSGVRGDKLLTAPNLTGTLDISPFNPKTVLKQFGDVPKTQDPEALTRVAANIPFTASGNQVESKKFTLSLDQTTIEGAFSLRNFDKPTYRFDVAINDIDVDRYLPPPPPAAKKGAAAAPAAPLVIPIDAIRALNADGSLKIGKLKMTNLRSSEVSVKLAAHGGLVNLSPIQAKLYSGSYKGNLTYDARGKVPLIAMDENLSGVEIAPLMKDMDLPGLFSGGANIKLKATARGLEPKDITASLNGNMALAIKDGSLIGVDLKYISDEITRRLKEGDVSNLGQLIPKQGDVTKFTALGATAVIKDGVIINNDLAVQAPLLNITGKGTVSLPAEKLDYHLKVGTFPVDIGGSFTKPTVTPAWREIAKNAAGQKVQDKATKKIQDIKKDLKKRLLNR